MRFRYWQAISLAAAVSFSSAVAVGDSSECSRNNIGEPCCSGGACMGGLCYPPGYPDSGDSYWCAACVPVPGPPCSSLNSGSPCDDAGNLCTALDNIYGSFANGNTFGVAAFACLGGVQPEAGIPDGAPCYATPAPDGGDAGVVGGGGATVDATVSDAAAVADATLADAAPDGGADAGASIGPVEGGEPTGDDARGVLVLDSGAGAEVGTAPGSGGGGAEGGPAEASASSSGGCSCALANRTGHSGLLLLVGVGALFARRRRGGRRSP